MISLPAATSWLAMIRGALLCGASKTLPRLQPIFASGGSGIVRVATGKLWEADDARQAGHPGTEFAEGSAPIAAGDDRNSLFKPNHVAVAEKMARAEPERYGRLLRLLREWSDLPKFTQLVEERKQVVDAEEAIRTAKPKPKKRADIFVMNDQLTTNLDETKAALTRTGVNLFQMNGRLVQLIHHNLVDDDDDDDDDFGAQPTRRASGVHHRARR